ncbi:TIGR04222 domain-containing membrane protein [Kitasatospora sp. NPDC090091]|uniref:TIGR04222 domain-containing membrane protein n=1 Tax=Kitasatospora sp. NPDC090091 TaxID=3364081 RepID=UPI00381F773D
MGGRGPRSAGSGAAGAGRPDDGRPDGTRPDGGPADEELSLYELAYLVGGGYRVAETALVRMIRTNRLEMNREGMLRVIRPRPYDDVEAVLLAAIGPSGTAWLGAPRAALGPSAPARELEARLRRRGLLVGGTGATGATGALRRDELLVGLAAPVLLAVTIVVGRAAAAVPAVDPGLAMILGMLAAIAVAAPVFRGRGRRQAQREERDRYQRPADRARPLLDALESGAAVPPGWQMADDAMTADGLTPWGTVAVGGVEALGMDRLTVAFHGRRALRDRPPRGAGESAGASASRRR